MHVNMNYLYSNESYFVKNNIPIKNILNYYKFFYQHFIRKDAYHKNLYML